MPEIGTVLWRWFSALCVVGLMLVGKDSASLRPILHLPRAPCDKFVYDFPYDFWGIVGGYGLRRICLHYIRLSCDFCTDSEGTDRDKSVRRLRGDCTEIVQFQCGHRAVSASFLWKWYGARAASVQRLYRDTVTAVLMLRVSLFTISLNMGGSLLRYDLKSPRDSRINSCIRVSKCPRVTRLSSHGFTHTVLSPRLCR